MSKLNLATKNEEQEKVKQYLEENASDALIKKINEGVEIVKDNKLVINRKDLDGFWSYAIEEARKQADKNARGAIVEHTTVFGWAIHYFEEDTIEGTLYNEDGSEYKPVKAKPVKQSKVEPKPPKKVEKQPQMQFSLFDMIGDEKAVVEPVNESDEDLEEPDEEEIQEALRIVHEEEQKKKISPLYLKYIDIQSKYPDHTIIMRVGDFYEAFAAHAVKISEELDLTLTGRDCGLDERVPMVGFPEHVKNVYIEKLAKYFPLVIEEQGKITIKEPPIQNVDLETGEIFDLTEEEMREFDGDIYEPNDDNDTDDTDELFETAKALDKDIMLKLYTLLDEKMTVA